MTPTRDLASRAQLCAGCHLGAPAEEGLPARDVNHDLIAAGHPRMDFELTEFLARMPSHWVEKEGNRALPSAELAAFQARAWAVGQIATAQAALGLLAERAGKKDRPWPELAEYDCFACHHDLAEPSWRQARGYGARRPGSPPWGSWSFALLPRALSFPGVEGAAVGKANSGAQGDAAAQAMESLDRLRAAMSQPSPDRVRVADLARSADAPLSSALAKTAQAKVDFALLPSLAQAILADASTRALSSYDDARQAYLAASALQNALLRADPRPRHPEIAEALTQLAKRLALPDNFNSPRDFDSTTPAVSSDSSPARVNPPREVP
jgi:hypothetical protein